MLSHPQVTSHDFGKTDGVQVNKLAAQDNFEDFYTVLYNRIKMVTLHKVVDCPMQWRHVMYCTKITPWCDPYKFCRWITVSPFSSTTLAGTQG